MGAKKRRWINYSAGGPEQATLAGSLYRLLPQPDAVSTVAPLPFVQAR